MTRSTLSLAAAALSLALPVASTAQVAVPGAAMAEAQTRLVCGAGTVLNATYLPGGLLQATCQSNAVKNTASTASTSELPGALQGTALTPGVAAAGVIGVVVLGAALGSDDTTVATTTTTSTTGTN